MSVIATTRRPLRRWRQWWPLALFICSRWRCFWLWHIWPQVLRESVGWQRAFNRQMSALIQAVAENPTAAGGSLLLVSFMYGVLHALGPGHGKVVITTWLATHPSRLKSSIGLTLASSLLQGLVAVTLVLSY
jgi:ABC-type nickel/cobalt efflux system permease component RcnA